MNPVIINCIGMAAPAEVEPLLVSSVLPSAKPYDRCYLIITSKDFLEAMGDKDNTPIREKLLARVNVEFIAAIYYCKTTKKYHTYEINTDHIRLVDSDFETAPAASIDLQRLLNKHSSDSFIHGGSQYHFATPSHNHTNAFFRLGDSIRNRDDLDRVTFWLLKHIDCADYIFIDSWSIAAIPLRALQILGKETEFDALPAHPAKKMVDCRNIVCAPTPTLKAAQAPLLLVSVVSSGSLVEKFKEIFDGAYDSKTLSTVSVYSFSPHSYSLCVVEDYKIVNYNFADCDFCKQGSKAIEIHPSAYYVRDPKDSGVGLSEKIAKLGYGFFEKYHAHLPDIVTFHKGDTSKGFKHYAYFLDYNQIIKVDIFIQSLRNKLAQIATERSVVLTLVDDPAIKSATIEIGADYRHTAAPENMLDEETLIAIERSDKVLIYDTVSINGTRLSNFNNLLRVEPRLSKAITDVTFLVGIYRPTSGKAQKELRSSLAYPEERVKRTFDYIEHLVLPDAGPLECPWCLELGAIKGSIRPALKGSGSFYRRMSKLSNLQDGVKGIDAIFHVDQSTESLLLGAESYLAPQDTTICGVNLAVASALQQMRTIEDDKKRLAPGFPYTQVLASKNFSNYSEGLIRSALLRNAAAIELGVLEKEKTLKIFLEVLERLDQACLLSEYIIAVICGKLPPAVTLGASVSTKLEKLIAESPEVMRLAAI